MTEEKELINDSKALQLLQDTKSLYHSLGDDYQIQTREAYEDAAELLKRVKGKEKDLESRRVYLKAPSLETGRRIDEWFKQPLGFLRGVESTIKKAMLSYRAEQDRRAAELQAIADRKAAEEQRLLARQALEAKMKADIEAQELEKQARETRDAEMRLRLTQEAEAKLRRAEEARRQLDYQASFVAAPVIRADKPQVAGQQIRRVWRFEIVDFSLVPEDYKILNEQKVRNTLNRDGAKLEVPGLRFFEEEVIASESR